MRIIRFLFAGGLGAGLNIGVLYILTGVLGLWYVFSAVIAFAFAYTVSFFVQKFWTFRDGSRDRMHVQGSLYLLVALINLCLNTFIVYIAVDFCHIHYLIAQVIASALVAVDSYFLYRYIFAKPHVTMTPIKNSADHSIIDHETHTEIHAEARTETHSQK